MTVTVALIDDHPVFREGLKSLLEAETDVEVVGEAADARTACAMVEREKPAVAVVDIGLPDGDGISVAHHVAASSPHTRVLALTMHTGEFFVARSFSAGVSGYVVKDQAPDEIVKAVRAVARGETYVPPQFAHIISSGNGRHGGGSVGTPFDNLSKREREIFDLILRGLTNEQMAKTLFISVKTVETHRTHINRKLRVHSTGETIRLAALHGLLPAVNSAAPTL
jgi:DNA-binding NarL/FixJ family response regulator